MTKLERLALEAEFYGKLGKVLNRKSPKTVLAAVDAIEVMGMPASMLRRLIRGARHSIIFGVTLKVGTKANFRDLLKAEEYMEEQMQSDAGTRDQKMAKAYEWVLAQKRIGTLA